MNILWLAQRDPLNPRAGGVGRTIYEVCSRLVMRGHEVTLLTGGWTGSKSTEVLEGIKILRYGKNIGPHLALPIFLLKRKYDVVVNDLGHAIPWISSSLLSKNSIAFFHHLHARSLPGQVNPIIAKIITAFEKSYFILYGRSTFVTESLTARADLIYLGINYMRIIRIPPGVDKNTFHPTKKTDYPSIVYFGGMRKYKRPEESIYLLKDLIGRIDDLKLTIVGSGPEYESLIKMTNQMNLHGNITFTGRLTTDELSKIVATSWLNVHTSVTEGWGFSILEAAAAGTPTVAYAVPGVVDAIETDNNGITVKDGDRKALAEATIKILSNPEKWWSSSIEVAKKYSWDKTAQSWEKVIQKIANH